MNKVKVPHNLFGQVYIEEKVLIDLEQSTAIQRLKHIDQSGAPRYFINDFPSYSRYEHSIGVMELLRRYNCSLTEQISGLLHDASHTAFSHIAELIFHEDHNLESSYQDDILIWFLQKQNIDSILSKYNYSLQELDPKNNPFMGLETNLPDLCADRIEYNLHHGIIHEVIGPQDVDNILSTLKFENNTWFFLEKYYALQLANLSLYFSKNVWGAPWNLEIYKLFADVLKYALTNHILNEEDLHFSTDENILEILDNSHNHQINSLLDKCKHFTPNKSDQTSQIKGKFRGVDPLVIHKGNLERLSMIDKDFKEHFDLVKNK